MKKFILCFTSMISISTYAKDIHHFACTLEMADKSQRVEFFIQQDDLSKNLGQVVLSNLVTPSMEDVKQKLNGDLSTCGIPDSLCELYMTPKWTPFEQAETTAQLNWIQFKKQNLINAIDINMGKSGQVHAEITEDPKLINSVLGPVYAFHNAQGTLTATAMGFHYPQPTPVKCTYDVYTGSKPGMSGSN